MREARARDREVKGRLVALARPAEPSIAQVLDEYLAEQRARLKPKAFGRYSSVIQLLRHCLDGYAYESLSKPERALFERAYNAEGAAHREFCELFGPERIQENLDGFLGPFIIRKVAAGPELLRAAGTVSKKLAAWLAEKGYVAEEVAGEAAERGSTAARDLPRAKRAARLLDDHARATAVGVDVSSLAEQDYLEFDHFPITRLEPGRLWLEVWETGGSREVGPIAVPEAATKLLRPGWSLSCALAHVRRSWRIVEMANVYPD